MGFSVLGWDSWGLWPINTHYIGDFPERYVGPTIPWTNSKVFIQNRSISSWGKFSKVMTVAVVFLEEILSQKGGSPANSTGFANCSCPLFGVGLFAIHLNRAEDDGTAWTSVFLLFWERKQSSWDIPCFSRQSRWSEIFLGSPSYLLSLSGLKKFKVRCYTIQGCFNWLIPSFTWKMVVEAKISFKTACLEFQVYIKRR